ncbi:MAG: hypothetical protein U1F23_01625 [Lysobacterales bacterium]
MRALRQLRLMPPAAAERLIERGGIGETIGRGCDPCDPRLLVRLLGIQQLERANGAIAQLSLREIQRGPCRGFRVHGRLQRPCILLRDQGVRDILNAPSTAAVLFGGVSTYAALAARS